MRIIIPYLILCLGVICNAKLRTWTAVNGKEVEAEFVSSSGGQVILKLKSGKVFEVPLNKLSKADQDFLKEKTSLDSLANNIVGKLMTLELEGELVHIELNEDGIMKLGEDGDLEDLGLTYKIEGNQVLIFEDGERNGGISFSSSIPKAGDQVEWGPEGEKMRSKITALEAEIRLSGKELKNDSGDIIHLKYLTKVDAATLVSCDKKASGKLVIPATIEGKPVTSIGKEAFSGCNNLTSITIPDSVTSIGSSAFSGCNNLMSITIPDGVTSFGNYAFAACRNLTKITIPDGVTSIREMTFGGCSRLKSITIGGSVTSIGSEAFGGCTNLTSITIPDSVTSIGRSAFRDCSSLTAVTFLGDAPRLDLPKGTFDFPTIYRKPKAKGWGDTYGGRPVKLISEKP